MLSRHASAVATRQHTMDPENQQTTNADPVNADPIATTATAPVGEGKSFTEEQVNAIVQKRLQEDRLRRAKSQPASATAAPAASVEDADRPTLKQLQARLDESEMRRAFDRRAARLDLSDEAAETLFDLYKAQKPGDPAAWFERTQTMFGFRAIGATAAPTASSAATATANGAAPVEPKPPAPAAPNAPAKVDPLTNGGLINLMSLTPTQLENLGPQGVRAELEKQWAIGNQLAGAPPRPKIAQRK